MPQRSALVDLLRQEKKYWLVPFVLVVFVFALLIALSENGPVAPFIYELF